MVRNWVIAPFNFDNRELFEHVWKFDRENGTIAIGWGCGDMPDLPRPELEVHLEDIFVANEWYLRDRHQLLKFMHDIQPGDRVIARGGRKRVVGIGEAIGRAYFDQQKAKVRAGEVYSYESENFLPVKWESVQDIDFPKQVFGMQTVTEMSEERFNEVFSSSPLEEASQFSGDEGSRFALEKHLEDFLVVNFDKVFSGNLRLLQEDELRGRQYPTDIGIIDILALDPFSNSYVVIELKRDKSSDVVVGQTLRYMGWVKRFLCREDQDVKGLIICRDSDERLDYALSMVPEISIQYYRVDFQLMNLPAS